MGFTLPAAVAVSSVYTRCLAKYMGSTSDYQTDVPSDTIGVSIVCAAICAPVLLAPTL